MSFVRGITEQPSARCPLGSGSRRPRRVAGLLVMVLFLVPIALAAEGGTVPSPEVVVPRIRGPLTLSEILSGPRPRRAVQITGFIQHDPVEGRPVSQPTTAYLAYNGKYLYVGFVCHDSDPEEIRAHVAHRDAIGPDDQVGVILDTYNDQRHAYQFSVNPLGIQSDALMTEGGRVDPNFDTLWFSQGRLTPWGYAVVIGIPFKSLRFSPARRQAWGIFLTRSIPRDDEFSTWPAVSRGINGFLIQEGEITGLHNLSLGENVQLMPYGFFSSGRFLDKGTGQFKNQSFHERIGLDAKWVLGSNLTLDATVNPDFSQVESDQPQITVNQRFEVFFPEKRPFFMENSNYFNTPIQALFTRRIADPQFGLRLTGKVNHTTIGALIADDRSPGETVSPTDPSFGHRATFDVLRISQDVRRESSIGVIWTDREFLGSYNRVFGPDGRWKISRSTGLNFQVLQSFSRDLRGNFKKGNAFNLSIDHLSSHWNYYWGLGERSPGFQVLSGFVPRVDTRSTGGHLGYTFRPENHWVVAWQPFVNGSVVLDHQNVRQDYLAVPGLNVQFARGSEIYGRFVYHRERFDGIDFLRRNYNLGFFSSASRWVGLGLSYEQGQRINFSPAAGLDPFLGEGNELALHFTVRPSERLSVQNTFLDSRLLTIQQSRNVFNNNIFRSRWAYQFTPRLSLRLIGQYSNVLPSSELSSLEYSKALTGDILLTYLVHPGTALYIGYNNMLENYNRFQLEQAGVLARSRSDLLSTSAGLFVKFSYLYQF